MHKTRVYVDTSVFGGTGDDEFAEVSNRFFARVRGGQFVVLVSELTYYELQKAPSSVQRVLEDLPGKSVEEIPIDEEVNALAQAYIDSGVLGDARKADALHVAAASVARADLILSWNFKHIVNFDRIRRFKGVNLQNGYPAIEIYSPLELGYDNQD